MAAHSCADLLEKLKMKQNKYDDSIFFDKYSNMERSKNGLKSAGEWHELKKMLPNFRGKRVLDLGCGFGWHCQYAIENGAKSVIGIDISQKMLSEAKKKTKYECIQYICMPIEDIDFPTDLFDVVISSLALHYIKSFEDILNKISKCLSSDGDFVFSVEHPMFTASGKQDWYCDNQGNHLHWPVDQYFTEGMRKANFLGEEVIKYHKTLTTYVNGLIKMGFEITGLVEPKPSGNLLDTVPEMLDELRRPMMLLVSARKK
jgi:SAM-dependent methyltransferase